MKYISKVLLATAASFLATITVAAKDVQPCRYDTMPRVAAAVQSLDGSDWKLSFWQQPSVPVTDPSCIPSQGLQTIPATVPGNVDIDLMAAGLEADPRIGNNSTLTRKWESYQWCYTKHFTASPAQNTRQLLSFGGIDTIADIWLNGEYVGRTENMLIEHRFDVTDLLKTGDNMLQVIIQSSVIYGRQPFLETISIGRNSSPECINIRKAPHMFGWDILPRVVSAGLWRSVEIREIRPVHIRDSYWMTATIDTAARKAEIYADVQIEMPLEMFDRSNVVFTISRNGKEVFKASQPAVYHSIRQKIKLDNVDFWWPHGYGEAALYQGKCEIISESGEVLATDERQFGIRTITLDFNEINLPEAPGKFCFVVNGEPIFIHGTNWVPLDALHSRDPQWLDKTIEMCVDMNCNMIRCWGGNVYEDHRFYELCDRNGLMVWQDFTFACNTYPQNEDFCRRVREEVHSIVVKLRQHPSIALWSGNNENDQALSHAIQCFNPDPNRDYVSREVIARVLWAADPTRKYIPSSPYYTEEVWKRGFIDTEHLPENHLWGPRGYYKIPYYTQAGCVFVSEIGYHGAPDISSLKQMMSPDCVYPWYTAEQLKKQPVTRQDPDMQISGGTTQAKPCGPVLNQMDNDKNWNEEWLTKSVRRFPELGKTYDRNNLMINQQNLLFGSCPTDLEGFVFGSQIVQAEAMKYFVEMWRGQKFAPKTGILWWNIKDGWPNISDAIVDYYFNKKIAYDFIKNVQRNVCCLIMDARNGQHPLVAVNDTPHPVDGKVKVTDVASGKTLFKGSFHIAKNAKTDVAGIPERVGGQGVFLITYEIGGKTYKNHYLYGKAPFNVADYRKWMEKTGIYNLSVQ